MTANERVRIAPRDDATVTVIIPAYGLSPHLRTVVEGLLRQTRRPDRIIVSHSASDDPSEWLRRDFPEVEVLHSPDRLFAGAARNRGAALADTQLLAFCDCDVLPEDDWLERLVEAITQDDGRFVVGSVGTAISGGYWGMANWHCEFSEQAPWRPARQQTGGASCNMIVRKTHFDAAGGFLDGQRIGEDTLLLRKLRESGLRQYLAPRAMVGHFNIAGFKAFADHQFKHGLYFSRVRKSVEMPGSSIIRIPPLAALLFVPKAAVVLRRMAQDRNGRVSRIARFGPGVVIGSLIFAAGAVRGAFERQPVSRSAGSVPRATS